MVSESYYWKRDLLKLARRLTKRKSTEIWKEPDFGEFEKEIIIGFYIIRKLSDSFKLSNATISTKVRGRRIPNNKKIVHLTNNQRYIDFFDFDKAKTEKFDLTFLANQLVHSYIFSPYSSDEEENDIYPLAGIHFCSDKNRNEWLYELPIDIIIDLFKKAGNDYPPTGSMIFDPTRKDYKVEWHNNSNRLPKVEGNSELERE